MKTQEMNAKVNIKSLKPIVCSLTLAILLSLPCVAYASMPNSAKETNIKADGFAVSWLTDEAEIGYVNYGITPTLGNIAYDDRGEDISDDTHHVTIFELLPETLYYYDIVSGGTVDDNSGAHYTITTAPDILPNPGSDTAYGQVYMPDANLAEGCLVYVQLEDNDGLGSGGLSQEGSSVCDTGGWWWFDLNNLRISDLSVYFEYSATGDNEILSAKAGKNTPATQVIDTGEDQPAPDMMLGWVLNLDVPWCEKELYSSAASCQTILNYIREGAGALLLTQDEIYTYGHPYNQPENAGILELDPNGMDAALGHFDPYDSFDPGGYGDSSQGYNFAVETFVPDAIGEYMRDVVHWMAFPVTQEEWWLDGELVARPNTPAAIPLYGSYDNWVVVTGAAVSNDPIPYPHTDPWFTPDFTVYGFWLTDPAIEGIGQHTYVTASECEDTYFEPLTTGDSYDGLYLQVAEPPPYLSNAEITIASPRRINPATGRVETLDTPSANGNIPLVMDASSIASSTTSAELEPKKKWREKHQWWVKYNQWWVKYNWRGLIDPLLFTDSGFKAAFDDTKVARPILVRRLDDPTLDYYLVPFTKRFGRTQKAACVIIIDKDDKHFKSATWVSEPAIYLPISKEEALSLVAKDMLGSSYLRYPRLLKQMKAELVWQPGDYSNSPFFPYWKVTLSDRVWYVTQEGRVIRD